MKIFVPMFTAISCLIAGACSGNPSPRPNCGCDHACGCKQESPHDSKDCHSGCDRWHKKADCSN